MGDQADDDAEAASDGYSEINRPRTAVLMNTVSIDRIHQHSTAIDGPPAKHATAGPSAILKCLMNRSSPRLLPGTQIAVAGGLCAGIHR